MIQVDKCTAKKIRNVYPNISIKRTVHKYYVEDTAGVRRLIGIDTSSRKTHENAK